MPQRENAGRIDPSVASTVREFAAHLRRLHAEAGEVSLRKLAERAGPPRDGVPFSKTTISEVLAGNRLPSREFVEKFTDACGVAEGGRAVWLATRDRVASNRPARARASRWARR
ncbi:MULTISPECIES: helix-turn-helix transcriptional regulator [Actinosynnema]|uniref:helix-turn-helix domain-containing protein n=1 Tax=Actinosynnema TaxID=40566 RepID=UPI0020A4C8A4|nr:helix-turn-helix transcriptional regulator [Actinosynnema pretiosum]MCP2094834.1 Helix-turn-helix domain-containing protein [Actinosynnema pretiosum]